MASITMDTTKAAVAPDSWRGFRTGLCQKQINLRSFIQLNYSPYGGDESFLTPATPRTKRIWNNLNEMFVEERRKGVLDISQTPGSITSHPPGYIDREHEIIVGLQTDPTTKGSLTPIPRRSGGAAARTS